MSSLPDPTPALLAPPAPRRRSGFMEDFQRFFLRGLGTLLPTIITIALIWYILNFLWDSVGWYLIWAIGRFWHLAAQQGWVQPTSAGYIGRYLEDAWYSKPLGILLALILIYLVGLLVGNFIGRTFYRMAERLAMRIPVVRAVYPAIKQVTDFLLTDRATQFAGSRVVAVQPHEGGIWSVALVTGPGLAPLTQRTRQEMVTVFVPSSPTAFSGYVMVVPRDGIVELPMSVEEAMRLLVSGGVLTPRAGKPDLPVRSPGGMPRELAGKTAEASRPAIPGPAGVAPEPAA